MTATDAAAAPATTPPPAQPEKAKEPEKADEKKEDEKPAERIEVDTGRLISGLQSPLATQVFTAGEYFRQLPQIQRREVLLELSAHLDPNVRSNTWRVFATVATKDDVPTLVAALQSPFADVQLAALETMSRFPNDQTIGILAKLLENADYRELAVGLLSRIGPACEAGVLPLASHADASTRTAAWSVLAAAGTRKGVQTLEQLSTQPQFQKDANLQRAITTLRERLRRG